MLPPMICYDVSAQGKVRISPLPQKSLQQASPSQKTRSALIDIDPPDAYSIYAYIDTGLSLSLNRYMYATFIP